MKIIRARFQTTIRVGSKEYNFIDGIKEKIDMEVSNTFLLASKGTSRVVIPFSNIAYLEEMPLTVETVKVTKSR